MWLLAATQVVPRAQLEGRLQMQVLRPHPGRSGLESAGSPGDFMQIKIEEALVWKSDSL